MNTKGANDYKSCCESNQIEERIEYLLIKLLSLSQCDRSSEELTNRTIITIRLYVALTTSIQQSNLYLFTFISIISTNLVYINT